MLFQKHHIHHASPGRVDYSHVMYSRILFTYIYVHFMILWIVCILASMDTQYELVVIYIYRYSFIV